MARPNSVRHDAIGLCFAHTGVNHNHHVALVVAVVIVAAVGGAVAGEGVDAVEVELGREFASRLVNEILLRTLGTF